MRSIVKPRWPRKLRDSSGHQPRQYFELRCLRANDGRASSNGRDFKSIKYFGISTREGKKY